MVLALDYFFAVPFVVVFDMLMFVVLFVVFVLTGVFAILRSYVVIDGYSLFLVMAIA